MLPSDVEIVDGYIVAPDEPTCCTSMAKTGSVIDYAVISNRLTPMVEYIMADDNDPYQPHRRVIMKFHGNMTSISEWNACTPNHFPCERPIGPHNSYSCVPPSEGDDLEEHAKKVMRTIESELAAKYHVDHISDEMGNCTFLNRSNGLNLKKSSCVDGSSNERQSSCHSLRLTQQKLVSVIVMAKKERMSMYSRGVSVAMDRAVDRAADSVNIPLTDSLKLECDQPKAVDLLTWYSNATRGHPQCIEKNLVCME